MTKKTANQWLKTPKYSHIEQADFAKAQNFFDAKPTKPINIHTFEAMLKMADVRYKTKTYRKRPVVVQAAKMSENTMIRTVVANALVLKGDYIVYDKEGMPHPMKKDQFEKIYEEIK